MNNRMSQPADFERRILLTLAGHSPAIITETLYALTQQQAYVPTEIHVITTSSGQEKLISTLLGDNGVLTRFCNEYGVTMPKFTEAFIHVITDANGAVLHDLQTEADNEAAADFITQKVRELTRDENTSLHVSIAGGRKTMTYYLGYAMSVFGRIQDRMSHVLVDDRYMSADFFYPTARSQMVTPFKGEPFDAKDVEVMLGDLPFIRLRDGLTEDLLRKENTSYSELITIAQCQLNPIKVEVRNNLENTRKPWQIFCSGREILDLNNAEIALYIWLLYRHKTAQSPLHFSLRKDNEKLASVFLHFYKALFGDYRGGYSKLYRALVETDDGRRKEGITSKYFSPKKTSINTILRNTLSTLGADHYIIYDSTDKDTNRTDFYLSPRLQANQISLPDLSIFSSQDYQLS